MNDAAGTIAREAAATVPAYVHLPFVPARGAGCELITTDGRRILDLYGGHAVAALGYGHSRLTGAICEQGGALLFQSNAVALDVRARAAEALVDIAPDGLSRAFFVNSGAEANENALRIACRVTARRKVLALEHGFHGRTAAAAAVTWKAADSWYGFPSLPFEVGFIPRDDIGAAEAMIGDDVAAVIFEPVQGIAGAYDLDPSFVSALRRCTSASGTLLIADEVQCGMGRTGDWFAVQRYGVEPDLMTSAKALAGGVPCGALLTTETLAAAVKPGDLGSTFGGSPLAAAAVVAVVETVAEDGLLANVRERESQIRESCIAGPVHSIRGCGLLLGLVCDRPAAQVQSALLERDILAGTSADPYTLRLLPPYVLQPEHVTRLSQALADLP
jgi:acetylornithine/N-succinyldiaminopimelate aminotransferase